MGTRKTVVKPLVLFAHGPKNLVEAHELLTKQDAERVAAKILEQAASRRTKLPVEEEPFYDPIRDGVTFSLLQGWLNCRESARLSLNGWTAIRSPFSTTFGGATHWLLQQMYEDVQRGKLKARPSTEYIKRRVDRMFEIWKKENPFAGADEQQQMEFSSALLMAVMPMYCKHWAQDFTGRVRWTRVEAEFRIPIEVRRRGQTWHTFLRGKMDGGLMNARNISTLFETKTKSRMNEGNLVEILPYELQVNLYTVALAHLDQRPPGRVLYNIIRRPGLRQRKDESQEQFIQRIADDVQLRPDWYFTRMEMKVTPADIHRFQMELADLVGDFLEWWYGYQGHYRNSGHCENKYGTCWALNICGSNNYDTVFKRTTVFRELEEY